MESLREGRETVLVIVVDGCYGSASHLLPFVMVLRNHSQKSSAYKRTIGFIDCKAGLFREKKDVLGRPYHFFGDYIRGLDEDSFNQYHPGMLNSLKKNGNERGHESSVVCSYGTAESNSFSQDKKENRAMSNYDPFFFYSSRIISSSSIEFR